MDGLYKSHALFTSLTSHRRQRNSKIKKNSYREKNILHNNWSGFEDILEFSLFLPQVFSPFFPDPSCVRWPWSKYSYYFQGGTLGFWELRRQNQVTFYKLRMLSHQTKMIRLLFFPFCDPDDVRPVDATEDTRLYINSSITSFQKQK